MPVSTSSQSGLPNGANPADDGYAAERDRVRAVRMQLLEHHPFWAYLLMQLTVAFDDALPAYAATDCVRHVWLNPVRTASLSLGQLGFVLLHQVAHQLHAVDARMQGRRPPLWHQAVDYVINRIVAGIPHPWQNEPLYEPPPGILLNRNFDRLVAESIYDRLLQRTVPLAPSDDPEGKRDADGADEEPVAPYRTRTGVPLDDFGGGLDLHAPLLDGIEVREELEARLRAAVARYEAEAQRGDIPGDIVRRFGRRTARVPWQRLLRQYANQLLANDEYDPRRPNRRWASEGFLVPGLRAERPGHVVVAIDTSGSMTPAALEAALAEVAAIVDVASEVTVIVADAAVHEVVSLDVARSWLRRGRVQGGGGTDHRPVFEEIAARRLQPELFVGITDLESEFPDRAPGYPVLWVVPATHGTAPWGRVVEMT